MNSKGELGKTVEMATSNDQRVKTRKNILFIARLIK
jgi:hypothetical protein